MTEIKIIVTDDTHWQWFNSSIKPAYDITGKYLFFSPDRDSLIEIVDREILSGEFHVAKIPLPHTKIGEDYVLCLYYENDTKKHELADRYSKRSGVRYKYWKANKATRSGQYSQRFLDSVTPGDRYNTEGT